MLMLVSLKELLSLQWYRPVPIPYAERKQKAKMGTAEGIS